MLSSISSVGSTISYGMQETGKNKKALKERLLDAMTTVDKFHHQMKNDPYIVVDGEKYYVKVIDDKNSLFSSILPRKKAVVNVNGKIYKVKDVPDPMACDKTKQVVVINGKTYNVKGNNSQPWNENPSSMPTFVKDI